MINTLIPLSGPSPRGRRVSVVIANISSTPQITILVFLQKKCHVSLYLLSTYYYHIQISCIYYMKRMRKQQVLLLGLLKYYVKKPRHRRISRKIKDH